MKIAPTKNFISKWLVVVALTFGVIGVEPAFQNEYFAKVKIECVASNKHKRKTLHFVKFTKGGNHTKKFWPVFIQLQLTNRVNLVLVNHSLPFTSQKFNPYQAVMHSSYEDALILS